MYFLGIQAFLAIVQMRSLNKAAEQLHLSQSAISYRLKVLEQEIGARLVERSKGIPKIQLTPAGEDFINLAERWNLLQQETHQLQSLGSQLRISVSAADSLNIYVLPLLYHALEKHIPSIRLQIRTQHTRESFKSVERKEMDIAFVVKDLVLPSVTVEPFFVEEMVLLRLVSPERSSMDIIDISSLKPENELFINWNKTYEIWHDKWWNSIRPSRLRLDTAGLIYTLMQDLSQWAIVPMSIGTSLAISGKFIIQRLSEPAPERICYKVTHKYPSQSTLRSLHILEKYVTLYYHQNM